MAEIRRFRIKTFLKFAPKISEYFVLGLLPKNVLMLFPASFLESHKAANLFCFLRPPLMNPPNVGSNLKAVAINRSADDFVPSYWLCGRNLELEECLMHLFITVTMHLAKLWCLSSSVMHTHRRLRRNSSIHCSLLIQLQHLLQWQKQERHAISLPCALLWWLNNLVANLYCASLCMSISCR